MNRFQNTFTSLLGAERLPAEKPGRTLKDKGQSEHRIAPCRIPWQGWVREMRNSLVDRHAAPNGEDKNGDDKRPEVELTPVPKWMIEIWRLAALVDTKKHQRIVTRIHERVD